MSNGPYPPAGYPPPPSPAAAWLFERYVRRLARRHFAGVHWARSESPERGLRELPTIFVANHTNWWDGFLAYLVSRSLDLRFQVLMEAANLERYPTFRRLGALPMRRERARQAYADLEAAATYLGPGVGLWVFPQGGRRPAAAPLGRCERGAAQLAQAFGEPVRFCPVALRYAYLGEQLPEAFVLVGEAWIQPATGAGREVRRELMGKVEAGLRVTLERLDRLVAEEALDAFEPLAKGRLSVNKRLDRVRHAVGLLAGRFEARNG